jgi:hypothetical protein
MRKLDSLFLAFVAVGTAAGCSDSDDGPVSTPAASLAPDVAVAWFDELYSEIRTASITPPPASRIIGYCGVAAYESVVGGMPGFRSLGGQLNDLDPLPAAEAGAYHWPSVLNAALADLIVGFIPAADVAALETSFNDTFDDTIAASVLTRSQDRGADIAAAILAWSTTDGFATLNNCAYVPPVADGAWEPTAPAFAANPLQPCWGQLRPMVLLFGAECPSLPPPTYSTSTTSAFYAEALEVRNIVAEIKDNIANSVPEDRDDIALFWADNPGGTGTPPGHWISVVGQVVEQYDMSLADAVEGYARVGMAVNDAFISCWDMKYYYNLLRPISYIDDFIEPGWTTLSSPQLNTPPFPEYTSGHSVQSGAAARVLTDLWGDLPFDDLHPALLVTRSFDSFDEAAEEAAFSRLYGGIHYRSGCVRGVQQGSCVGQAIVNNVEFRE